MSTRDDRMTALFDYMILRDADGATVEDMAAHLECSIDTATDSIRDLRRFLGDSDEMNLTCDKQEAGQRWLYRLVTKMEDHREWIGIRMTDTESRLVTIQAILASAVRSTDGRTLEGKRARVMFKQISRLMEDLRELEDQSA